MIEVWLSICFSRFCIHPQCQINTCSIINDGIIGLLIINVSVKDKIKVMRKFLYQLNLICKNQSGFISVANILVLMIIESSSYLRSQKIVLFLSRSSLRTIFPFPKFILVRETLRTILTSFQLLATLLERYSSHNKQRKKVTCGMKYRQQGPGVSPPWTKNGIETGRGWCCVTISLSYNERISKTDTPFGKLFPTLIFFPTKQSTMLYRRTYYKNTETV